MNLLDFSIALINSHDSQCLLLRELDSVIKYAREGEENEHFLEVKLLSCVRFADVRFATPWTVVYQTPPSMGFSRQEYWSGLPLPSLGDLPNPGIEPGSPAL